jgi:hypothetical protein
MLHEAGIKAILDHHALPGVSSPQQMFAGNCTPIAQFYVRVWSGLNLRRSDNKRHQTAPNYARALTWTAVMTTLSHLDPDFEPIFAIQAVNEPIMDATQTPGLQQCEHPSLFITSLNLP